MTSLLITPNIDGATVSAATEARAKSAMLLAESAEVTTVTDRLDFDSAMQVHASMKSFIKTIEDAHEQAKAPVLKISRAIDQMKKDLTAALLLEKDRIGKLCGIFEQKEREKALEVKREADAETARIAHKAQKQAAQVRIGIKDAEQADRASDQVIEEAQTKIVEIKQAVINAAPVKTAGTSMRQSVQFEVIDIKALYAAHPEMVTLEPNGAVIRSLCKASPNLQVPGLRHWMETKLS